VDIRFFRPLLLALVSLLCFTACSEDEGVEFAEQWEVTAVLTPTGLGDLGYNDQMYLGLCYIREQLGCQVVECRPSSIAEGQEMAKQWMQETPPKGKHRLLILCDERYETALRQLGWKNSDESAVLQLDCQDDDLDIYTRSMPLYGACRAVGRLCKETLSGSDKHATLVLANPHDLSINDGKEGFLDGTKMEGVDVDIYYLSQEAGMGYTASDSLYHLCYEIASQTGFLLPLSGGSNKGVYQYGRESHSNFIWTCALDSDLSYLSYSSAYGIMKYVDQMLLDFTRRWKEGQPNDKHQICGLASGYVKVEVNRSFDNSWGKGFDEIIKEAIECENKRYQEMTILPFTNS